MTRVLLTVGLLAIVAACNSRPPPAAPSKRIVSSVERDAAIAASIKESLVSHLGEGDWYVKTLSVKRDGSDYSSFGSVKPVDDYKDLKLRPWTAVVRWNGENAEVVFLTYGFDKAVIYKK